MIEIFPDEIGISSGSSEWQQWLLSSEGSRDLLN